MTCHVWLYVNYWKCLMLLSSLHCVFTQHDCVQYRYNAGVHTYRCIYESVFIVPALGAPCCWMPVGSASARRWWEMVWCGKTLCLRPTSLIFHPFMSTHCFPSFLPHHPLLFPWIVGTLILVSAYNVLPLMLSHLLFITSLSMSFHNAQTYFLMKSRVKTRRLGCGIK